MNRLANWNEQYRKEWRELGFYYEYNEDVQSWRIQGTYKGAMKFCRLLELYVADPGHQELSAHEHYGPHDYLKIVTWHSPEINADGIYGRLEDIERLSALVKKKLKEGHIRFIIGMGYSPATRANLEIMIERPEFDPSGMDKTLR